MRRLSIGRFLGAAAVLAAATGLAGCGEEPQQGTQTARKVDSQSWDGAEGKFSTGDWKAGDRASWERQLKERTQRQNEYARVR